MFKLSVPKSIKTYNEKTLPTYLEYVKKCNINRVFLCGLGEIYDENAPIFTQQEKIKGMTDYAKRSCLLISFNVCVETCKC